MELILISKTKLKIMLDESDMKQYEINDSTDCAEPSARKAIRSILDRARDEIGFETEGAEIFVQLYTSRHGGCELFVSKSKLGVPINRGEKSTPMPDEHKTNVHIEERSKEELPMKKDSGDDKSKSSAKGRDTAGSKNRDATGNESEKKSACSRMAFSFPTLTELTSVCKILKRSGVSYKSSAFVDDSGRAFLLLFNVGASLYLRLDKLTFILEYGQRENPTSLLTYIGERGKTICLDNAVEVLADF